MSGTNEAVLARSLMAYKRNGGEPTYAVAIALNPNATRNPDTSEPVNKKVVYTVMGESAATTMTKTQRTRGVIRRATRRRR